MPGLAVGEASPEGRGGGVVGGDAGHDFAETSDDLVSGGGVLEPAEDVGAVGWRGELGLEVSGIRGSRRCRVRRAGTGVVAPGAMSGDGRDLRGAAGLPGVAVIVHVVHSSCGNVRLRRICAVASQASLAPQ